MYGQLKRQDKALNMSKIGTRCVKREGTYTFFSFFSRPLYEEELFWRFTILPFFQLDPSSKYETRRACDLFLFLFNVCCSPCEFPRNRDLGDAVKKLKTALENHRTAIREKNSHIKALEERLEAMSTSAEVTMGSNGTTQVS